MKVTVSKKVPKALFPKRNALSLTRAEWEMLFAETRRQITSVKFLSNEIREIVSRASE